MDPPQSFVGPKPEGPADDVQQAALRGLLNAQLRLQLPLLQLTCGKKQLKCMCSVVSCDLGQSRSSVCVCPTLHQEQSGHTGPGLNGRPPAALLLLLQTAAVEVETEPAIIWGREELTQEETLLTHHRPGLWKGTCTYTMP